MFLYCYHKVVIMPRAGEGRSIRIDPEVYEALLTLKRGNMTFSDVIEQMLHDRYGWLDIYPPGRAILRTLLIWIINKEAFSAALLKKTENRE